MHKLHYKKIAILLIALALAGTFSGTTEITRAQTNGINTEYTLLTPLPTVGACPTGSTCSGNEITSINLSQALSYAYKFLLALAVVLAVFMITVGGFEYMLSGAADTKSDAVKRMQNAVAGLVLALIAYLLLYTIDPNLVNPNELNALTPVTYGSLTQTNRAVTALDAQLKQDQLNATVMNNAAQIDTSAQNSLSQASTLYNQNNCSDYDSGTGNYQFGEDASPACQQAAELFNQYNNQQATAAITRQQGADSQRISSVTQVLDPTNLKTPYSLVPCTNTSGTGVNQCYEGFQLDPTTQATLNAIVVDAKTGQQTALQGVATSNNGSQNTVNTEYQTTLTKINAAIQNGLVQKYNVYKENAPTDSNPTYGG